MLFVNPLKKTGSWIINQFEYGVIDRLIRIPDNLIESSSYALKNLQSGKLSWYLLSTVVSILLIVLVFIYR